MVNQSTFSALPPFPFDFIFLFERKSIFIYIYHNNGHCIYNFKLFNYKSVLVVRKYLIHLYIPFHSIHSIIRHSSVFKRTIIKCIFFFKFTVFIVNSATLLLVPLLGLQYILTPFKPEPGHQWEIIYEVISAFTTSFQVRVNIVEWKKIIKSMYKPVNM